jgi:hypothetical protein
MYDTSSSRLTRRAASDYLKVQHGINRTPGTLAKLATTGGGPKFRKVGQRHVLYDVTDLDSWANSIISEPLSSTSERAA